MDHTPRSLTPGQLSALQALSRRVVDQLELRRQAHELVKKEQEAGRLLQLAEQSRRALLGVLEDEQDAMASLRESEERFREMAGSIDEVFWLTDSAKNQVLYISPAYEKNLGAALRGALCRAQHLGRGHRAGGPRTRVRRGERQAKDR